MPKKSSPPRQDSPDWDAMRTTLNALLEDVDWAARRAHDPVDHVWAYEDPADAEVVALLAAVLAYGRVTLLKRAIVQTLEHLGPHPAERLKHVGPEGAALIPESFVYRMTRGEDINALLRAIAHTLREEGSLRALFLSFEEPKPPSDYQRTLSGFVHTLRDRSESERRGLKYLLANPSTGGACKRLNLFLRWMIRPRDAIDPGLWNTPKGPLSPARLVIPLDTHIQRISHATGLGTRKQADWKLAAEITQNLKRFDSEDPLRYDFAVCHMGISGQW